MAFEELQDKLLLIPSKAGETGMPIIALRYPPLESNVEWKVDVE